MESKRDARVAFGILLSALCLGSAVPVQGAESSPLARIVEGARSEGVVKVAIAPSGHTAVSMRRLSREIQKKYGVTLDIQFAPTARMAVELSKAMMEYKLGSAPTYDLMTLTIGNVVQGVEAGIFEKVDWASLLDKATPTEVIVGKPGTPLYGYALVSYTTHRGLMYNPRKIPPEQVPKTLADLADPKWRGRVGIHNYPRVWAELAFVSGKEKTLSEIRAIMKNKAIQGAYSDLQSRYLLEEIWMAHSGSAYLQEARMKGVSAEWQSLEVSDVVHVVSVVRVGAKHPNAAKLVAVYLASSDGSKLHLDGAGAGNFLYPGNYEYSIAARDKKQGLLYFAWDYPGRSEFLLSKEVVKLEKEVERIFKGG
jgi:ABC-type Fe3+ transport system substrate-binding protein